jgi:hypothetical protein
MKGGIEENMTKGGGGEPYRGKIRGKDSGKDGRGSRRSDKGRGVH